MAKSAGIKRVRFAESRSTPNRRPLPYLHCNDKACTQVKRYKVQSRHEAKYHQGKETFAILCTEVNCDYCIYRKSPALQNLLDPKNSPLVAVAT